MMRQHLQLFFRQRLKLFPFAFQILLVHTLPFFLPFFRWFSRKYCTVDVMRVIINIAKETRMNMPLGCIMATTPITISMTKGGRMTSHSPGYSVRFPARES